MSRRPLTCFGWSIRVLALAGLSACCMLGGAAAPGQDAAPASNKDAPPAEAAPAEAAPAAAERLVAQLGDDAYDKRRLAAEALVKLGLGAREALLAGLASTDLEVKRSCRRILADVLEADYQRRLKAFIDDKEGDGDHDLPGWERFRDTIGKDRASRELFVEMQNAESALLESYEAGQDSSSDALRTRFNQVASMIYARYTINGRVQQQQPSKGTVAALMFVASDAQIKVPREVTESPYWQNIIQMTTLQQSLTKGGTPEGRLFGRWLLVPVSPALMQRNLQMALQFNAAEGLELGMRMVEQKDNNSPMYRAIGLAAIGRLNRDPLDARRRLEAFLEDKSVCYQQQRQIQNNPQKFQTLKLEMRDVALAWLIYVTGQKQEDYFRPNAKQIFDQMKQYPQFAANVHNLYFEPEADQTSDQKRDKALEKWNKWAAEHPLPKPDAEKAEEAKQKEAKNAEKAEKPAEQPEAPQGANAPAGGQGAAAGNRIAVAGAVVLAQGNAAVAQVLPAGKIAPAPPAGRAAPAGPVPFAADEEPAEEGAAQLERADRQDVQKVLRAARLIEDKFYSDAAYMLGEVLETDRDYTYQPDRGVPLERGLKIEAERLLASMPEEGLRVYRLAYEAGAARMLDEAVASGDEQSLLDVMRRYFHTKSGAEATYLLGTHYMNSGHALRASLCLERVRLRSRDYQQFEPALSLKLAACWSMAGMPELAERVLLELKTGRREGNVDVAGAKRELFQERGQALSWLAGVTGAQSEVIAGEGWTMYRGDASRNQAADNGNPYLQAELLCAAAEDQFVLRKVNEIQREMLRSYQAQLPSLHPLVVDDTIVVRTTTSVRAFDFATGQPLWEAPFVDALRHLVEHHSDSEKQRYDEFVERGLKLRLWQDATFGTMSSDGKLVFGVEELPFGLGGDYRRLVVLPDGRRRLDPGTQKSYNLLSAYDVKSGKVRWEAGGPAVEGDAPLAGAFFLGPPLPMGGRLYVVAQIDDEVRLVELEADTGRPVWQLGLAERAMVGDDPNQMIMLAQMGISPADRDGRTAGASPSSAAGVLICPLSDNEYAAVDLTTRTVMWLYSTHEEQAADPRMAMLAFNRAAQKRMSEELNGGQEHWADTSVTIAGDSVLLTPVESHTLFCLGLADGNLRWKQPRGDGFYVAGVQDGRVLVAGRGSLRALNIVDGAALWSLSLPPGSVTSGRGYLGRGRYFLPLSSGEVAQIELTTGKLLSRSRALDRAVPGNLVRHKDAILSQGVDGLRRFTTLDERLRPLELALAGRPDDPALLADLGEVLLYSGRIAEAVDMLDRAHQLKPEQRTNRLLADALVEGLRIDYARFAERARGFEPVDGTPQRIEFLKQLALALRDAGRLDEAFATLLRLAETQPAKPELVRVEYRREVRQDRWIATQLDELWRQSTGAQREAIDRLAAEQLAQRGPEQFLAWLGRHPLADEARLLAARGKTDVTAAMRLFHLLEAADAARRNEAVARLAVLLRDGGSPAQAAPFYRALGGELADVVCLDGKTGRELAAAAPADHAAFRQVHDYWPVGRVEKTTSGANQAINHTYPIAVSAVGGALASELSLDVDNGGRRVVGRDAFGRKRLDVSLPQNTPNYIGGNVFTYSRAFVVGDYAIAWIGNRVCAFDLRVPPGKLLWTQETIENRNITQNPAFFMMVRRLQMPRQVNGQPGGDPMPLAMASDAVFFQKLGKLTAVDPLSGELLWSREALAENSDLFADDDLLFVQQPDEDDALVLSTLDGRELGRRKLPDASRRVATRGRNVLTWGLEKGEQAEGEKALSLFDAWDLRNTWQRRFSSDAVVWLASADEVAVLDQHTLRVIRIADGADVLSARLAYEHAPSGLVVAPSYGGYLVAVNKSEGKKTNLFAQSLAMTSAEIHGTVFGLDASGKTLWTRPMENQMLRLSQPSQLPVATFLNEVYEQVNRTTRRYYELVCVDRRDGAELHKLSEQNKSNQQYELVADPDKHTLQIRSQVGAVDFKFSDK